MYHPGRYWQKLDDGRIQCDVCPRKCKLHDGQRGLCFVRQAKGKQIVLTTYGRSSGFCIDPIEKKPLNHFLPGTPILSLGTAGCNLGCKFCQNWDISKSRQMDTVAGHAGPDAIRRPQTGQAQRGRSRTAHEREGCEPQEEKIPDHRSDRHGCRALAHQPVRFITMATHT